MSLASKMIETLFRICGVSDGESARRFYGKLRKNAVISKKEWGKCPILCGVKTERSVYCGMPYYLLSPKEVETSKSVMYLHGSGYRNPPCGAQLKFAAELARNTHAKVYVPLYPKLPMMTVRPCFALLDNFYGFLRKKGEVLLVGDSSGGALCLSLAAVREDIRSIIAISPWVSLDIGAEGRQMKGDVMLCAETLDRIARLWAYDLPYTDVKLSPLYGDFKGKDILLLAGGKEILAPDIRRFFHVHTKRGASITYVEKEGQQHCYPLMPTPEGREARDVICGRLQSRLYGEGK